MFEGQLASSTFRLKKMQCVSSQQLVHNNLGAKRDM